MVQCRSVPTYPVTGTFDDLLSILARAQERRAREDGLRLPAKPRAGRILLEPLLHCVGLAVRAAAVAMPASLFTGLQDRLFKVAAGPTSVPFDAGAAGLEAARRLAREVEREAGTPPALLCLMSHPPVTPEWLHLNVEMTRHVLQALPIVRGGPCRPRLVIAVDPYALDMLNLAEEALYAGFTGNYHLGLDRLAHSRVGAGQVLLAGASWKRMPWRLLRLLRRGGEAGLVPAGGVPSTARVLYALRESMARSRRERAGRSPSECLDRLRTAEPDFARFLERGPVRGGTRASAWRAMEAWVIARLSGEWPEGSVLRLEALDAGRMTPGLRADLTAVAAALGVGPAQAAAELVRLEGEFARETPYRGRLFGLLARRICARKTPVVLLPLTHRVEEASGGRRSIRLDWRTPVAWLGCAGGAVRYREAEGGEKTASVEGFAEDFIRGNFA